MSARTTMAGGALSALLGACASPFYAQFPPVLAADGARVERADFAIVLPRGFTLRGDDPATLDAFEQPPDNGQNRLYRTVRVEPAAAIADDDDDAMAQRALALLRARHAGDGLEVRETGRVRLADRDGWFLRGRIDGTAAGWSFEVLEYLVPGEPRSLVVAFAIPEGQLDASRAGFAATAATLQTTLAQPKAGPAGALEFHDGGRIGLRLPSAWERRPAEAGALAVFAQDGGALCELSTATTKVGVAFDVERIAREYVADQQRQWPGLRVLASERRTIAGRRVLRLQAAFRSGDGTVVVDDTFATDGERLDRLLFRMPHADYLAQRAAIDRAVASLHWR